MVKAIYTLGGCLLTVMAFVGFLSLEMPESRGQEAVTKRDQAVPDATSPFPGGYKSVKACRLCHRGQIRELDPDQDKSFVLLNEPAIWLTDPHSKAFEFIDWSKSEDPADASASQQLSREICHKLGIPDIHKAQECLSCHANWVAGLDEPPLFYTAGVGCESCHGPSAAWENEHKEPTWRARSVAYKADKGMVDVRHPVKRAEQCFSCHIGNVKQGKHITHEMFAAGHPPLPSIEIESFAKQMPRHWRYLEEKIADSLKVAGPDNADEPPFKLFDEFIRENYLYLKSGGSSPIDHNQAAAAVVLGGVVALREMSELTHDLARPATNRGQSWPELAVFDCTACHHELRNPSWRQTRSDDFRPGRPTMHAWPTALVRLAIFHISDDGEAYAGKLDDFTGRLFAVQAAFEATPFGDPPALRKATADLSQWLTDDLIASVVAKPFDDTAVRRSRTMLFRIGSTERQDYDSARQIAWALRTLCCDLSRSQEIQDQLDELTNTLRLDLPNTLGEFCQTAIPGAKPRESVIPLTDSVSAALANEVQFDPVQFMKTMSELKRLFDLETEPDNQNGG
jgi:hypothetical protein